jgi:hypothetical protein
MINVLGYTIAYCAAVPLGVLRYFEEDQSELIRFLNDNMPQDGIKNELIDSLSYAQSKRTSLVDCIKDSYENLRDFLV